MPVDITIREEPALPVTIKKYFNFSPPPLVNLRY